MKSPPAIVASLLLVAITVGCGPKEDAATNTKNSTYIDSGKTSADLIGQDRAAAHRPRLPGKGAGN